jgi:RNA polymerase sigma factor (sigma-70 family)
MAAIFQRHHQALHRYCYSIVGNSHDAADALQNSMVKVLKALPGETRQIALRPWLFRIAHNEAISLLRARRLDSDLDAAVHLRDEAAAAVMRSREGLRSLTQDLGELTERQRGALLMRELGGLDYSEVADALGTTASAVKQSVYEARCALLAMAEGREMGCETVRRTLSDGDRRKLRGMRIRGHLRDCAVCRDFEVALHRRPAQLTAMIPPLPVAAAAAMLPSMLGGAGIGGGGLLAGLGATTTATAGCSLTAKAVAVAAVGATLAGAAVYSLPELVSARPEHSVQGTESVVGAKTPRRVSTAAKSAAAHPRPPAGPHAPSRRRGARDRYGTTSRAVDAASDRTVGADPAATPGRTPTQMTTAGLGGDERPVETTPGEPGAGHPVEPHGATKSRGTPAGRPEGAGKPPGTPTGRPEGAGKPAGPPTGKPPGTPTGRPDGAGRPAGAPNGKPDAGASSGAPEGAGKPPGTPTGKPDGAGKPPGTPADKPEAGGRPAGTPVAAPDPRAGDPRPSSTTALPG